MYLLFDIGGTKTRLAISVDGNALGGPRFTGTPRHFEDGISWLARTARELSKGTGIEAAAGGVAGVLDRGKGVLISSNMPDWDRQPLREAMQEAINAPVYLENDAAVAGLGEATVGAGKGKYAAIFAIGHVLLAIGVATLIASFLRPAETTVDHPLVPSAAVPCPECGQSFAGQNILNWHLQQVHGR